LLTVIDGEGAAQPAVVAPGPIGLDETRLEDFDLIRLQASSFKPNIATLSNLPAFSPLSVGRQKTRAYSGIVEERLPGARSDFLE
jgi:hypothetical protein